MRRICLAAVIVCAALSVPQAQRAMATGPVGRYQDFGDARGFLNILPPGQDGGRACRNSGWGRARTSRTGATSSRCTAT